MRENCLILISIVCINLFASKSLLAQQPTKAETIKWLKQKLEGNSMFYTYEHNNGYWPCHYSDGSKLQMQSKTELDLNNETITTYTYKYSNIGGGIDTSTGKLNELVDAEICQVCTQCDNILPIRLKFKAGSYSGNGLNYMFLFLDWRDEGDLQDRMLKAFKRLINLVKPKEAF